MEGGRQLGNFAQGSSLLVAAPAASSIKDQNTQIEQLLEYNYQRGTNYVVEITPTFNFRGYNSQKFHQTPYS